MTEWSLGPILGRVHATNLGAERRILGVVRSARLAKVMDEVRSRAALDRVSKGGFSLREVQIDFVEQFRQQVGRAREVRSGELR